MRPFGPSNRLNIQKQFTPFPDVQLTSNAVTTGYPVAAPQSQLQIVPTNATVRGGSVNENNENAPPLVRVVSKAPTASEMAVTNQKDMQELSEVVGDLVVSGSGFNYVTDLLSRGNSRLRRSLYESIFSQRVFSIACNNWSGYNVITMLIDNLSVPSEQQLIANALRGHMVVLSSIRFASRIVQRVLEKLDLPTNSTLVAELRGSGRHLVTHSYGNHVIQVVFARMRPIHYGFIIEEMIGTQATVIGIICDRYGCRILEFAIEALISEVEIYHSSVAEDFLRKLVKAVVDICDVGIVAHEYGNYVVQKIISAENLLDFADTLVKKVISGNVLVLSQKKHGSHVIQTILRCASPNTLFLIMQEIFDGYRLDLCGKDALDILMVDRYGNYVVQTMLDVTIDIKEGKRDGLLDWFKRLSSRIIRAKNAIINFSSGRKLLDTLDGTSFELIEVDRRSTDANDGNSSMAGGAGNVVTVVPSGGQTVS